MSSVDWTYCDHPVSGLVPSQLISEYTVTPPSSIPSIIMRTNQQMIALLIKLPVTRLPCSLWVCTLHLQGGAAPSPPSIKKRFTSFTKILLSRGSVIQSTRTCHIITIQVNVPTSDKLMSANQLSQLNNHGRFWGNKLENTLHHHHLLRQQIREYLRKSAVNASSKQTWRSVP